METDFVKYEKEFYIPNLDLPLYGSIPQWNPLNCPFP
jgi:hypothetical protein